jgi:hypothetical protein
VRGASHITRCRKDVTQLAKDSAFGFLKVNRERWTYLIGADFLLQPNEYYMMIVEQAKTRASGREPAFESCGLADRIRNLRFAEDLGTRGLPIATGLQPDVNSNVNLADMLRNFWLSSSQHLLSECSLDCWRTRMGSSTLWSVGGLSQALNSRNSEGSPEIRNHLMIPT